MPFEPKAIFDPIHSAIEEGIDNAGLSPLRADDIFSTRSGMEKILRGIAEAEVVVADMTGRNANVFYETGIAHTIKDNVVLLTQNIDDIPFDFRHIDHIEYEATGDGLKVLTDELSRVVAGLPQEPPFQASPTRPSSPTALTPAEARRHLGQILRSCERHWASEVVPSQSEIFESSYQPRFAAQRESDLREAIADSMDAIHPRFLEPWQPIEELGLDVIEAGVTLDAVLPDLTRALERAYNLAKRSEGHPTVVGHGQLLALRTWMLWGAYALERRNWRAVNALLHQQLTFDKPTWSQPRRAALGGYKYIFGPDASGRAQGYGYIDLAISLVWGEGEALAGARFMDVEEARGYMGLWLLASDLAEATTREDKTVDWPAWSYSRQTEFERLLPLLEDDSEYAADFSKAVTKLGTAEFNALWTGGLRQGLLDYRRLGIDGWRRLLDRRLPTRFAE